MPELNAKALTVLQFLDWAVENRRMELHIDHAKPFTTDVDLPAGWGSGSSELVGIKIYYKANKLSRSHVVGLMKEWSSL